MKQLAQVEKIVQQLVDVIEGKKKAEEPKPDEEVVGERASVVLSLICS